MHSYQERMIEETEQLDARIEKLSSFLKSPAVETVTESERSLMGSQLHAMRSYSFFLHERMRRW